VDVNIAKNFRSHQPHRGLAFVKVGLMQPIGFLSLKIKLILAGRMIFGKILLIQYFPEVPIYALKTPIS